MAKVRVASLTDVAEGRTLRVDVRGRPLLLSRLDGRFFAIDAICSHAGGRLEDGDFQGSCVVCPIHSAVFDRTSGKVQPGTNWASDLESFPVAVEGESLFVEMGNKTETPTEVQSAAHSNSAACPFSAAKASIDFDPMSADQRECPFDLYREAREGMPVFYSERFALWVITRYDDIVRVLKDPATFSSAASLSVDTVVAPEVQAVLDTGFPATPTLVTADPPMHTRFRELVGKAFTSRRVAQLEPQMVAIANRLIDAFVQRGSADIVRQFAYPFPMEVIAEILGLPLRDLDRFKRWSDDMSARFGVLPLDRQIECARSEVEFQHYFAARLEERRHAPKQDFLSDLLNARVSGERPLDVVELLSILKQLLIGGNETSTNMIGSAMLLLMTNAEQLEVVLNDRTKIADVVEEVLRLDSPVQGIFRTTTREVELGGVRLPEGAHLELLYASANRDETRFRDADRFDIHRDDKSNHMAFGFGIHFCIGAQLARYEGRIALETLLDRLPCLRLTPGQLIEHHPHFLIRGLKRLEIEWDTVH